ncbi:hypothetical protein ABZP36_029024 [Zizania latifolia]
MGRDETGPFSLERHQNSPHSNPAPVPPATGNVIAVFLDNVFSWTAMIRIVPAVFVHADFNRPRKGFYLYQASACRRKGRFAL